MTNNITCPNCGASMHKAGLTMSGSTKRQLYKCGKCPRSWLSPDVVQTWNKDKKIWESVK